MKVIVGLIGENGSGKETFSNILEGLIPHIPIERVRTGDILRDVLDVLCLPKTRANLQLLAEILRDKFAPDVIAQAAYKRILESKAELIILDGMRWFPEVQILRKLPNNFLVYITAKDKIRFERLKLRKEKTGEGEMGYEQFLKEEQAPAEKLIKELSQKADVNIINNRDLEGLRKQVEQFYNKNLKSILNP